MFTVFDELIESSNRSGDSSSKKSLNFEFVSSQRFFLTLLKHLKTFAKGNVMKK